MKEEDQKELKKYVSIGSRYVAKKLLMLTLLLVLLFPVFADLVLIPLYNHFFADHTLYLDSPALAAFSGSGKVYDQERHMIYAGEIVQGQFHGKGRLYDETGNLLYSGDFEGSVFQGVGRAYAPEGALLYAGGFESGQFQGQGKLYDRLNGHLCYEGSFEAGLYSGQGTLYAPSGRLLYEGSFAAGRKNGFGKLYADNGRFLYDGLFQENVIDYASWPGVPYADMEKAFYVKKYMSVMPTEPAITRLVTFEGFDMAAALDENEEGNPGFVVFLCLWGEELMGLPFPAELVREWTVYDSGKEPDGKPQMKWMEGLRKNHLFPKGKDVPVLTIGYQEHEK